MGCLRRCCCGGQGYAKVDLEEDGIDANLARDEKELTAARDKGERLGSCMIF